MIRFISFISIVLLLFTGACSSRKNKLDGKEIIPEKELIPLLTDIYIANGLLSIPRINSEYSSFDSVSTYYLVIEKHGFTREMMDNTMKYYFIKNPKKLNKIYDQVLGILSEMDSRVEKEALIEQNRKSNLWTGKEFYAEPSTDIDSTWFDIKITNPGFYSLSFSATVYPDDQSPDPLAIIYSVSHDSLATGKEKIFKSVTYLKDGQPHSYFLKIKVEESCHLKGCLLNSEYIRHVQEKHYLFEDISLSLSSLLR